MPAGIGMAQAALLLVPELVEHLHDVLEGRAGVLLVAVVELLAVHDVALLHGTPVPESMLTCLVSLLLMVVFRPSV
jgi:hypothetical protein